MVANPLDGRGLLVKYLCVSVRTVWKKLLNSLAFCRVILNCALTQTLGKGESDNVEMQSNVPSLHFVAWKQIYISELSTAVVPELR